MPKRSPPLTKKQKEAMVLIKSLMKPDAQGKMHQLRPHLAAGGTPTLKQLVAVGGARKPSKYNLFVKEHYADVKHLPNKERFPVLGQLWLQYKAEQGL